MDAEAKRDLRAMVARVWGKQKKLGIATNPEPLRTTLMRRLRKAIDPPKRSRKKN